MLRCVDLVRTDVSEELSASFIRVTRIGELGTTLAVTSNRRTLSSSETSVLTSATRRNTPEDGILHSHRRENLTSYTVLFLFASADYSGSVGCLIRPIGPTHSPQLTFQEDVLASFLRY
jgi:hypothetical protein